ncbi:MAG: SDR family oxidoreductase [Pseudomonadota bacterium]
MMLQSLDFTGRRALVTGASRGVGQATARLLAAYGATVTVAARSSEALQSLVSEIEASGGRAKAVTCDVADWKTVEAAVAEEVPLDILVNCAGTIDPLQFLADSNPALWSLAIDVNVKGYYHFMRAVLPRMIERGHGTVVNISSGAVNSDLPGWSHYCASKAAARKLTEVAARELREAGHDGVRVIGLSPGTVATDMMAAIRDSGINIVSRLDWNVHIPPEWAAEGVAYLCGPGGDAHVGTDFSIKTPEGRRAVGLPTDGAPNRR